MGETRKIALTVNGTRHEAEVEVRLTLADFLRHTLGLTGTHLGCEHGVCGACTVLLDGAAVRSCLLFAVQAEGSRVTTVEALAGDGDLHPLQDAFHRHHALQCGYCTPGFLMALAELWERRAAVTDEELTAAVAGQLCRCTGYAGIVAAARDAFGRYADAPSGTEP